MFGKLSLGCILVWALILGFGTAEAHAADFNLIGTWKATWAKITPSGCSSEVVTLRILRQSGNLIGGDITMAGYTTNWVGKISSSYSTGASGSFDGWQWVGSSKLEIYLSFNYNATKPNEFPLSIGYMHLDGNETFMNTRYDTSAPLLRQ
jgi:hypothetical protein